MPPRHRQVRLHSSFVVFCVCVVTVLRCESKYRFFCTYLSEAKKIYHKRSRIQSNGLNVPMDELSVDPERSMLRTELQ